MACYFIYSGLGWPGISTAFVTCCFIALENTEATMRKGWLRLLGCAAGGLAGYLVIIFLIPHMESITSLVLLTVAGTALTGWVAAGTDRISYAGLQAAFAFFLCIFQGYAPDTNFTIIRDRLAGIVIGIVAASLVYRYVWPEHAVDGLRIALARVLRSLSKGLLMPSPGGDIAGERKAAVALHRNITKDLDNTLRLSELMAIEAAPIPGRARVTTTALEHLTAHTQSLSLMTTALFAHTKLEEWEQLPPPVQKAELGLREHASTQLERVASFVERGQPVPPCDLAASFDAWHTVADTVTRNDRPRLVRRIIGQIKELSAAV
jgi:multidrug resistance protein MdtO